MIDLSDARALRPFEVTPELTAAALRVLVSALALGDAEMVADGIAARVETHTNGTTTNPAPHPHRGITLYRIPPHDPAPPMHATLAEGIDISKYQGSADFSRVVASGRTFAVVRASDGLTYADPLFEEHYQRAGDVGLARGTYHFFRASRSSSDQVARYLDLVAAVEAKHGRAELPPCLDFEVADGVDLGGAAAAIARGVESLSALGRRPLLYTMPGFFTTLPPAPLSHLAELSDLWLAQWGPTPHVPRPWTRYAIWQYASTARVDGVTGPMDADRFCGTADVLRAWGAGGALPAPALDLSTPAGVQHALNVLGVAPQLAEDGIDGVATRAALRAFQGAHGLLDDGIAGPATLAALRAALAGKAG